LQPTETLYRQALQYLPNYGNVLIRKLINEFGSASFIFEQPEQVVKKMQKYNRNIPKPILKSDIWNLVYKEQEWMEKNQVRTCFFTDFNYPYRLKSCNDAPYLFYYQGNIDFNKQKIVSVVGTRHLSAYGRDITKKIISEIKEHDITIISGMAEGIDTVAHKQALANNLPTIAILGSGLNHIYPYSNKELAKQMITENGALISEYPYYTKPDKINFPKRNRIIAGMSDATLVMESALKGGSMITAYIAHSYNRDVFAVPGSVFQNSYSGCHALIRRNVAALFSSGEELLEMMGWNCKNTKNIQTELFIELDDDEKKIVELLKKQNELLIDELKLKMTEYSTSKLASILLQLELKGVIECLPGKKYKMI
jgi:DNA processing protein